MSLYWGVVQLVGRCTVNEREAVPQPRAPRGKMAKIASVYASSVNFAARRAAHRGEANRKDN
jgi:hypothetical protein